MQSKCMENKIVKNLNRSCLWSSMIIIMLVFYFKSLFQNKGSLLKKTVNLWLRSYLPLPPPLSLTALGVFFFGGGGLSSLNRSTGPIRSSIGNVHVSVCVSVCLFDVPFTMVYFAAFFAPTSQSQMSKKIWDSESLGKSVGKKWSQNWIFMLGCGLKSPRKKSFFFCWFLPYKTWWKPRFLMD